MYYILFYITDSDIYFHLYGELFNMTNILIIYELETVEDLENMLIAFENWRCALA